jgi:nucleoside-diphosphate-sugar epimerase
MRLTTAVSVAAEPAPVDRIPTLVARVDCVHVAVIGAAGMIGRKLVARVVRDGQLGGTEVSHLSLVDLVQPDPPAGGVATADCRTADLASPGAAETLIAGRPDVIVHLAAVVSGQAEADFDLGYRVNLDGTRALLEAIRAAHSTDGYRPRLVFSSSIAVFGAPMPDVTPEDFATTPLTSYGTQKAIGELLLSDYSRRGFLDGVAIRLPTICIRPGRPNQAASGFFSGILREPLVGQEAILPVPETVRHWFASPRSAVEFCLRAAVIDTGLIGPRRTLSMPGLSATVGEQIEALRRVAGERAVQLIRREPDPTIMKMIDGWATALDASRAERLGFAAETSFDEIIRVHLEDELHR